MKPLYQYKGIVKRIVDGDTVICTLDLGFKTYVEKIVRLAGINAPELNSHDPQERASAILAKTYLEKLFEPSNSIHLDSKSIDIYGRPIGVIYLSDGRKVNDLMLESGNAEPYKTH